VFVPIQFKEGWRINNYKLQKLIKGANVKIIQTQNERVGTSKQNGRFFINPYSANVENMVSS